MKLKVLQPGEIATETTGDQFLVECIVYWKEKWYSRLENNLKV